MQTSAESQLLWWLALATAVLVLLVVAALLTLVHGVAAAIDDEAGTIGSQARDIARSTIQLLYVLRINTVVGGVIEGAGAIQRQAGRLLAHAQSCPGCPDCRGTNVRATGAQNAPGELTVSGAPSAPGAQSLPGARSAPDAQRTPGALSTPDPQHSPDAQRTPDAQGTPGAQKAPESNPWANPPWSRK